MTTDEYIREAKEIFWRYDIKFRTANHELHFMIEHDGRRIDFWPTTERWIARGFHDVSGFGVVALLDYMKVSVKVPRDERREIEQEMKSNAH